MQNVSGPILAYTQVIYSNGYITLSGVFGVQEQEGQDAEHDEEVVLHEPGELQTRHQKLLLRETAQ